MELDDNDVALLTDVAAVIAAKHLTDPKASRADAMVAAGRARARLEATAATVTGAFHDSFEWACDGARSTPAWITSYTGVARANANSQVKVAKDLRSCPAITRAFRAGELSLDKVRALVRTRTPEVAGLFAEHEAFLVANVKTLTVAGAETFLRTWANRAAPDGGTDRFRKAEERTHLHFSPTTGGFKADGFFDPVAGAAIAGALHAEIDAWYRRGILAEDHRTYAQLQGDALAQIVERGMHRGDQHGQPRPLVLVCIDADTLAGRAYDDPARTMVARSEILGAGPVPAETIRRLLCDADISRVVLRGDSEVLDVGRRFRLATAAIRRGVIARSGGHCELCHLVSADRCQVHHNSHWARDQGETSIDESVLACNHCHHLVHEGGWSVIRGPDGTFELRKPGGTGTRRPLRHTPSRSSAPPQSGSRDRRTGGS